MPILVSNPFKTIHSTINDPEKRWEIIYEEIREDLDLLKNNPPEPDLYSYLAISYQLPYHLAYLIARKLELKEKTLTLKELASVSFYTLVRDVIIPFRRYDQRLLKWFGKFYSPNDMILSILQSEGVNGLLNWFFSQNNGLTIFEKTLLLENQFVLGATGVGTNSVNSAFQRLNIDFTVQDLESKRYMQFDMDWAAALASYTENDHKERPLTTIELIRVMGVLQGERRSSIKRNVLESLLKRMGKIELYVFGRFIKKPRYIHSRAQTIVPVIAELYKIDEFTLSRAVSMQSLPEIVHLLETEGETEKTIDKLFTLSQVVPLQSFRPMLADTYEQPTSFPVLVEAKYDGTRLVLHKLGNIVAAYSRRRIDATDRHEELVNLLQALPFYSVVLDAEFVGFRMTTHGREFATIYDIHQDLDKNPHQLSYTLVIFDILHFNGQDTSNLPLLQRRGLLEQIIPQASLFVRMAAPNLQIELSMAQKCRNVKEIHRVYQSYLNMGLEGAVVKEGDSVYLHDTRKKVWMKLKPKLSFDVLLSGVLVSNTPQGLKVSGFRFSVRNKEVFEPIGFVTGIDQTTGINLLQRAFNMQLVKNTADSQPILLDVEGETKQHYGYELKPGIVVTIDAFGTVKSDDFIKFRSPRFLYIREDINLEEILTMKGLINFHKSELLSKYG